MPFGYFSWIRTLSFWLLVVVECNNSSALMGEERDAHNDVETFLSKPVEIDDKFEKNTLGNYRIQGEVDWSLLSLSLPSKSHVAIVKTLAPDIYFQTDIWPAEVVSGKTSLSRINLVLANSWQIQINLVRSLQNGQVLRQVVVNEIDSRDRSAKKPKITKLKQTPPFQVNGDVERWSMNYKYGLLHLSCNEQKVCSVYCSAFSSWINAVAISQELEKAKISRLKLSGDTIGYSAEQRNAYNEINAKLSKSAEISQLGDLAGAIRLEREAIEICKEFFGENDSALGLFYLKIAEKLNSVSASEDAIEAYQSGYEIMNMTFGPSHPETLLLKFTLTEEQITPENLDAKAAVMKKVLVALIKLSGTDSCRKLVSRMIGIERQQIEQANFQKDYLKSLKVCKEMISLATATYGEESIELKRMRNELSFQQRLYQARGEELTSLERYLQHYQEMKDAKNVTEYTNFGRVLVQLARKALPSNDVRLAEHLLSNSYNLVNEGDIDHAILDLTEAISIFRESYGEEDLSVAFAMGQLGAIYSMVKRYDEASVLLDKTGDFYVKHGMQQTQHYARIRLEQGQHLIRMGRYRQAGPFLAESLQVFLSLGKHVEPDTLKSLEELVEVFCYLNNKDQAKYHAEFHRNLVVSAYGEKGPMYANVLLVEAKLLTMLNKYDEAIGKYLAAESMVVELYGKNGRPIEPILSGLIDAYLAKNDIPSVVKYFEKRLEYEIYHRERLFNVYSEEEQLYQSLYDLYSLDGLIILALEGHIEANRAYSLATAFKGAVTARQRSARIAFRSPDSRRLVKELSAIDKKLSVAQQETMAVAIEEISDSSTSADKKLTDAQDLLVKRRKEIQTELVGLNDAYSMASQRPTTADVQQNLPHDVVLIDYFEYIKPRGYFEKLFSSQPKLGMVAFVLKSKGDVQLIDLGPVKPIHETLQSWRSAMYAEPYYAAVESEKNIAELTDDWGHAMRKLVWDPLAKSFDDVRTVIISPSIHLSGCPFAAFPSADENSFLIEEYAVVSLATPRLLPEILQPASPELELKPSLLLVGDVDYDAPIEAQTVSPNEEVPNDSERMVPFKKLLDADLELNPIRTAFTGWQENGSLEILTDKQASEERVREKITQSRFVHFHTHGFCLPALSSIPTAVVDSKTSKKSKKRSKKSKSLLIEEEQNAATFLVSGIALAGGNTGLYAQKRSANDGILWSYEIQNLDLSGAELVTLSACQTALGEPLAGEGIMGAQRAIHIAGARSSLTALWAVNDQSTRDLMTRFYAKMWDEKQPKAEALQQAMTDMLRNYKWIPGVVDPENYGRIPPALWAGFVLHGDWR